MADSASPEAENLPTFSVIIPLFNRVHLVERALSSVRAQTAPPTEIIAVDDGSTDGSAELITSEHPDVVLIRQENQGVGGARNSGMAAATGEWLAFLDSDDIWMPNHLFELGQLASTFPEVRLVATSHRRWLAGTARPRLRESGTRNRIDYFQAAAKNIGVVWSSAAALRRDAFRELGGFGPWPTGEDLEYWTRVALRYPVAVSTAETALYVRGEGGLMETHMGDEQSRWTRPAQIVAEISPAAGTIVRHLSSGQEPAAGVVAPSSLLGYLDARVLVGTKMAMVERDPARARRLLRLLSHPSRPLALAYWALTRMPVDVPPGGVPLKLSQP